jgi:hypothetical protein
MPEEPSNRILERIERMLRKTVENGASEEEAMSAAMVAQKLMIEHGLSLSDVEEVRVKNEDVPIVSQEVGEATVKEVSNKSTWKDVLIAAVAVTNRCTAYWENDYGYVPGSRRQVQSRKLRLIGTEYNRFATMQIYNWLEAQIEALAKEALYEVQRQLRMKQLFLPGGLKPKEYTASWKQGCSTRVSSRIRSALTEVLEEHKGQTFAIVATETIEQQKKAVEEYKKKKGLRLVKTSTRFINANGTGYNDGWRDGGDVDLSPSKSLE